MDARHFLFLALASAAGLAVGAVAAWAACRWWYSRKLQAAAGRLHKSDQARLFSQQQTMQARRQIELLKADIASQQKSLVETQAARQRAKDLEQALRAAELATPSDSGLMPLPSSHGFADTQIMP
ncbi:MAG: hypothetical protein ABJA61_02245 [Caldimonas sp.]